MTAVHDADNERLVRRAVDLFTFLGRSQQLLDRPVRLVDKYDEVVWFGDLPEHSAIQSAHRIATLTSDAPLLIANRVPKLDPPKLPTVLTDWIDGDLGKAGQEPTLREAIYVDAPVVEIEAEGDEPTPERHRVELADRPEVSEAFETWMADWRLWSDQELRDAVARDVYKELFAIHLKATDHSEEFELVAGIGCLSWRPEAHEQVRRHVATAPIGIDFDQSSGQLTVRQLQAQEVVTVELDMLDPAVFPSHSKVEDAKHSAAVYEGHLLDQPAIGAICRRVINVLDPAAQYDEDSVAAPQGSEPRGAFAPAIILRRRTNRGMVKIYEQIVAQIKSAGEVPAGVLPLIDPNRQPESTSAPREGAVVTVDDEEFLPLPVNEAQRRIIDRVDNTAQTIVQGPPGTGKTHTAAALVSHLLAQGKRVLITAQTDRALKEVREKLPREIQSLAVAVVGQSRSDMADLRTAVDNISRRADEFEVAESQRSLARHTAKIDDLRRQRADARNRLLVLRRQEVERRSDGPVEGTLAAIAHQNLLSEDTYTWIREFSVDPDNIGRCVATADIQRWRSLLMSADVAANEQEATRLLPDLTVLMSPNAFAEADDADKQASARRDSFGVLLQDRSFEFVQSLNAELRVELRQRVSDLARRASDLERRGEAWMNEALRDVRSGRQQTWVARSTQVKDLAQSATQLIGKIGVTTSVTVSDGDLGTQQQIAKSLMAHLDSGTSIKVQPDGQPKIGAFTSKTVKLAAPFFASVKVNDLPAVSKEQLSTFIDWVDATRTVTALDQAWPSNVVVPDEDTLSEKVQWHLTEVEQLDKVLALGQQVEDERQWFQHNNIPVPDWNQLDEIRRYASLVEAVTAADEADAAKAPIAGLHAYLRTQAQLPNSPAIATELLTAARERDIEGYAAAYERLEHLYAVAQSVADRERISADLRQSAPKLASAVAADPAAAVWDLRLSSYEDAWCWEMTRRWILAQDSEDPNALKIRLNDVEQQIRQEVELLAAERAWGHAVSPDRITPGARANLTQYAQLVTKLGKGTGKYAMQQRAAIADAMDRCRPSVPVWIMPLYRIAEQVRIEPNLYDVVIVDEASQAGLEASFLQYLAPKMVVIGDDKQVSPSAVGVDQQQLRDLANMFIHDDPYKESWVNPQRSYFDEANMRFGGRITLTEHRRCVPEIIGFSNRVAYEPEGIRLVPVRQFGAERLEPIKVVYLSDGYDSGSKTNEVEAQAIVDQIRKCLVEPHYDGATFGVVSLLGKEQARLIERKLLDAVAPEEMAARQIRCGDASDFQGSERDVMFLSMVKGVDPDKRLMPLTQSMYVQRFNVAASRAKDQMWVYHSMPREALSNAEDMRFQLLDYCYGVVNRLKNDVEGAVATAVPEDVQVSPFDSLFEQRVFNRLIDRGYTVVPQYEAMGYRIDMVVTGSKTRLAVECDGDFWHGPDEYDADLARQRELERCGWTFFRIRESQFYADMPGTLQKLWDVLDQMGIHTADWIEPSFDGAGDETPSDLADGDADTGVIECTAEEATVEIVSSASGGSADRAELGATDDVDAVEESVHVTELLRRLAPEVAASEHTRHTNPDEPEPSADELTYATTVDGASAGVVEVEGVTTLVVDEESPEPSPLVVSELAPYVAFSESLPPVVGSQLNTIVANIVRIVEVEGPVLGHRLHDAYRIAYGGQRIGKEIARVLNQAIELAVRRGLIVADNPLKQAGVKPRTFRAPGHDPVVVRQLGPRTLSLVPPAELAVHLGEFADIDGLTDDELYRAVLDVLGLKRLTDNVRSVLSEAMALVADANRDELDA